MVGIWGEDLAAAFMTMAQSGIKGSEAGVGHVLGHCAYVARRQGQGSSGFGFEDEADRQTDAILIEGGRTYVAYIILCREYRGRERAGFIHITTIHILRSGRTGPALWQAIDSVQAW